MSLAAEAVTVALIPDVVADNFFVVVAAAALVLFLLRMPRSWKQRLRSVGRRVEVRPERDEVRRGEQLRVAAAMRAGGMLDRPVKLGLVCVERYDVQVRSRRHTRRDTREDVAFEAWAEASPEDGWSALFTIPRDAPYSYSGSCLSFAWLVEAREVERFRPDSAATRTIRVRP